MEWYGIVTMETAGCNSERPEGGGGELMTEDGGDARSRGTLNDA